MFKPLNSDQQAIAISKGFARRTGNGDLIHSVRTSSESLESIAKWYTGSSEKASLLASENNLSPTESLTPGLEIKIPLKELKQVKMMPPGFH